MANKFTGITSAGVNVPVYDKEAHQALGNVYTKSEVDTELNTKQDKLVAGANITIDPVTNVIAATGGGGGGGSVYTDSSLSGNGTASTPLGLSKEDYDLTLGDGLTYSFNDEQKTVALDLAIPVRIVNAASEATDTGVLYLVVGQ